MISSHPHVTILLAIFLLGPACKTEDDYYCEGALLDNCVLKDMGLCAMNSHCTADTPVCDVSVSVSGFSPCVECTATDPGVCGGPTPVCRSNICDKCMKGDCGSGVCKSDGSCANCTKNEECDSDVCLPGGSCVSDTDIAYVDPTGTDTMNCTKEKPCKLVSNALARARPYVKFTGTTTEAVTIANGRIVTFLAEQGAKLTRAGGGAIVTVRDNGTALTVYDLSISDATGAAGIGIVATDSTVTLNRASVMRNAGGGISTTRGILTVSQSTISDNTGGGIEVRDGQFDLTNNFISGNGDENDTNGSLYGGVQFLGTNTGARKFEFNTVADNKCRMNLASGVMCTSVTAGVTFSSNIVYDNQQMGARSQVSVTTLVTNCSWTYSDIGATGTTGTVTGTGNFNVNPMFVSLQNNLHLQTGTGARDRADPTATLTVDFDGQPRPLGMADVGADEIP